MLLPMQPPGQHQEDLFTVQPCSVVPDLVACLSKSSSQISVVAKTMQAIRQHVMNDTVFQQQHKAFSQSNRAAAAAAKVSPSSFLAPACPIQTPTLSWHHGRLNSALHISGATNNGMPHSPARIFSRGTCQLCYKHLHPSRTALSIAPYVDRALPACCAEYARPRGSCRTAVMPLWRLQAHSPSQHSESNRPKTSSSAQAKTGTPPATPPTVSTPQTPAGPQVAPAPAPMPASAGTHAPTKAPVPVPMVRPVGPHSHSPVNPGLAPMRPELVQQQGRVLAVPGKVEQSKHVAKHNTAKRICLATSEPSEYAAVWRGTISMVKVRPSGWWATGAAPSPLSCIATTLGGTGSNIGLHGRCLDHCPIPIMQ